MSGAGRPVSSLRSRTAKLTAGSIRYSMRATAARVCRLLCITKAAPKGNLWPSPKESSRASRLSPRHGAPAGTNEGEENDPPTSHLWAVLALGLGLLFWPALPAGNFAWHKASRRALPTADYYVVQMGDTWTEIAARNGLTYAQLQAANPTVLRPGDVLWPGDRLFIPGATPVPGTLVGGYWYTVQPGDTWQIVARYRLVGQCTQVAAAAKVAVAGGGSAVLKAARPAEFARPATEVGLAACSWAWSGHSGGEGSPSVAHLDHIVIAVGSARRDALCKGKLPAGRAGQKTTPGPAPTRAATTGL